MDKLIYGDCLKELYKLSDDSVDLIVTDPPYGYSFMGKDWDKAVPSVEIWKECLRVLKPGAFAFVMSAPRQDVLSQMIVRIGEAGFDTDYTSMYHTYASGFPKAMNIGKMVDKRMGAERKLVAGGVGSDAGYSGGFKPGKAVSNEAVSNEAVSLNGSYGGFQPKPAVEVIIVAMKPLSEKTYVDQALKNGKGVTWLDDCRIPITDTSGRATGANTVQRTSGIDFKGNKQGTHETPLYNDSGRFPANLLVSDDVLNDGCERKSGTGNKNTANRPSYGGRLGAGNGEGIGGDTGSYSRYFDLDAWANQLPFLIVPKASKREKGEDNKHPTVKPLKLMSYLITLGSREGDVVLDPFLGSGTTALAAKQLDRQYIGIEREKEYLEIAEARLAALQPTLLEAAE